MKAILYIHGKGGSFREAEQYKKNCPDFDIIGVDYDEYLPWIVQDQIKKDYENLREKYDTVYVIANSIGAYFAMHTLQKCDIKKALFISPVLDMERLILDMMQWANVTEEELREKEEIATDFGETLSWKYIQFVRGNPIQWDIPTEILYGEQDNLTSRKTVDEFIKTHNAALTVMKDGEHWFHRSEQMGFLDSWMEKVICSTFKTRDAFRQWLMENCLSDDGIWLLFDKSDKKLTLKASEALEEALCFGWIDGQMKSLDEQSYKKYFSLRRKNSKWSEKNKALVIQLEQKGLMTDFGRDKIEEAKTNGQWDRNNTVAVGEDDIESLTKELVGIEPAYTNFLAMSPSVKKTYTKAYQAPKTAEGKQKRLQWIIDRLNQNLKPM